VSKQATTEPPNSKTETAYVKYTDKPVRPNRRKLPSLPVAGHRKSYVENPVYTSSSDTEAEIEQIRSRDKRRSSLKPTTVPIPNVASSELQQLRSQNEQLSQILQSLANRVDDLVDSIPNQSPPRPVTKTQHSDQTDQLVTKMQTMIDKATKTKRKHVAKYCKTSEQSSAGDSDPETVSNRQLMRPMKFDGTGSFETFIAHFRNCSEHNKWTKSEQLSWLKCSLIKNAGQVLWDLNPESTNTFQKLVDVLANRFGGVKQTDKHRMELKYRKRKPNEALTDLHQDISRLMALAHPQLPSSSRDTIAVDYFIDSLNDADFALKVRERSPSSLDDALRVSLQLEAWIRDTNRSKTDDHTGGKTRSKEIRGMAVADKGSSTEISAIKTQISSLGKQVNELCKDLKTHLTTNTKEFVETQPHQQPTIKSKVINQDERPKGCFNCHDPSHMKSNCPLLQPQTFSSRQPATTTDRRACYQCGEFSHVIRNCPQLSNGQNSNRQLRGSSVNDSCKVYISAQIEGNNVVCLLDSGCEQTIVPLKLIKKCGYPIHHTDKTVRAANGTKLDLAGESRVVLSLKHDSISVNVLVSHDVEEVMLGYDFLVTNNCVWKFGSGQIFINGNSYTPFARRGSVTCRRVYVTRDTVIPAKQQANLPVRSTITSLSECVGSFIIEPKTIQTGVYLGRTMLPTAHHDIVVRAVNTMNEPRLVKKGSCLGTLTPTCDSVDTANTDNSVVPSQIPATQTVIDRLPTHLDDEQRKRTVDLLRSYEDIFSQNEYDIGRTHLVEHTIDTGNNRPIRQSLRRHPIAHLDIIDQQVGEMLEHGIIEPAASPWASNVVLARKKDGSLRLCVDYRNLNQITYQDTYPLPHMDTCLNTLQGASWFSTLDLRSGYYNIPIREVDKDKTAFITRRGCWRYNVMPFGLTCAPSVFQRLMDLVLCGLTYEACMVYLDDIVIFSSDFDTHISRLQQVFERLRQAGLKLKASKCHLLHEKVEFLGHVISAQGLEVQEGKIESVKTWPVPTNLHDVRSFVSFCSYYRRFILGFADIASPLYHLTKKGVRFSWGPEQQQAFDTLKSCLISAPVLAMPMDNATFILDTDASDIGLGAVLSQVQDGVERPLAYSSRSLNRAEQNYCTTRKELLAVIYGLKQYRQFLLGRPIIIRTDHSSLQWLRRTPEPMAQQARWLNFVEQFNYTIEHRPGNKHANADALSRIPHPCRQCTHCEEVSEEIASNSQINVRSVVQSIVSDLIKRRPDLKTDEASVSIPAESEKTFVDIATAQQEDPDIGPIVKLRLEREERPSIHELQSASETTKILWSQWHRLVVRNGVVYKLWFSKGGEPTRLLLLTPRILREEL
jgi:predicted aspartyl protease